MRTEITAGQTSDYLGFDLVMADNLPTPSVLLADRGYDVGGVDGILGSGTRAAVQDMQERLGLPADAWPTRDLLERL